MKTEKNKFWNADLGETVFLVVCIFIFAALPFMDDFGCQIRISSKSTAPIQTDAQTQSQER
jgi:hypothetical protein